MTDYIFNGDPIKTIMGVPIEVAFSIYQNDNWFNTESPARHVKCIIKEGNVTVEKSNPPQDGFFPVKKSTQNEKERKSAIDDLVKSKQFTEYPQTFYNICFSVWGNKGPYEYFVKYYEVKKEFPQEDHKKQFLAHLFWV